MLDCSGPGTLTELISQPTHGRISDFNPAAGTLTYEIVGLPAHGTVSDLDPDTGTHTCTPIADFTGTESYAYRASNAGGVAAPARVTITVGASNRFHFGRAQRSRKLGTAKLTVQVPGPGSLRLAQTRNVGSQDKRVTSAGKVRLTVRPRGKGRKRLNRRGELRVRPRVIYTPLGGDPRTKRVPLKLKLSGPSRAQ